MIEADMDVLVKFDCQATRSEDPIETEVKEFLGLQNGTPLKKPTRRHR
jgi:hypothetical protein